MRVQSDLQAPTTARARITAADFGRLYAAFSMGMLVGLLGGMIGLGGAEFRLPLLISMFGFVALQAVILNKAMSLAVVATALPARLVAVSYGDLSAQWTSIVNLLAGSLIGAWAGASWATKMRTATLHKVLAGLLVLMAGALLWSLAEPDATLDLAQPWRAMAGVVAGFAIGVVAAVMGVAGGELLIPTIVVLYGLEIKLAGSMSLAVSLPTMLVAFARYSRDQSFVVIRTHARFAIAMTMGSISGALAGGLAVDAVATSVLIPALAALLLASSVKMWRH
jgi:uncharacterized membrane protein YfcA